jgi:hypothetical protein
MRERGGPGIGPRGLSSGNPIVQGNASVTLSAPSQYRSQSGNFISVLSNAPLAAAKLARMTANRDATSAKRQGHLSAQNAAYQDIVNARADRDNYNAHARAQPHIDAAQYARQLAEYEDHIARRVAAHKAIQLSGGDIMAASTAWGQTEERAKKFLNQYKGGKLTDAPPVTLAKGATVESVRAAIADLWKARLATEESPPPYEEMEASLMRDLEKQIERGRPRVVMEKRYFMRDRARQYDMHRIVPTVHYALTALNGVASENGVELPEVLDAQALLSWLYGDRLRDHLKAELKRVYDLHSQRVGVEFLGKAERKARIADLDARLLTLERGEAELVWQTDDATFRGDCSVLAILGVTA